MKDGPDFSVRMRRIACVSPDELSAGRRRNASKGL